MGEDKAGMDIKLGELDQYYFGEGTHYEIYKKKCLKNRFIINKNN